MKKEEQIPKVGQETSVYVAGTSCKVEEVRIWDGHVMVKLERMGGVFDWEKVKP